MITDHLAEAKAHLGELARERDQAMRERDEAAQVTDDILALLTDNQREKVLSMRPYLVDLRAQSAKGR